MIMFPTVYGFGSSPLSYKEGPNLLNGPEMLEKKRANRNFPPTPSQMSKKWRDLRVWGKYWFLFCVNISPFYNNYSLAKLLDFIETHQTTLGIFRLT